MKVYPLKEIKAVWRVHEDAPKWAVGVRFTASSEVAKTFDFLKAETQESFWALHLDAKNRPLCYQQVSVGSLTASIVHPREVFKTALLSSASSVLFVHNHPSGDPAPSREDHELTKRLKDGGELLGLRVLDHIIVGDDYYSFADHGEI